jgi:hypothetical protein
VGAELNEAIYVCLSSGDGSKLGVILFLLWSVVLIFDGFAEWWTCGIRPTGV